MINFSLKNIRLELPGTKFNINKKITTVKELIAILKQMPDNLPVFVSGYESGFETFYAPCIENLKHEPKNKYYEGEYQQLSNTDEQSIKAVVLARMVRNN